MDTGPYASFRPAVTFTEAELQLLFSTSPTPDREPGVFTVREVANKMGWTVDHARRIVFGLADRGLAEQTFVKVRKRNGVWQTASAYRLLTKPAAAYRTDVLVRDLTNLFLHHGIRDAEATALRVLSCVDSELTLEAENVQ